MKYYLEVTLINGDKSLYEIWSIVYTQLHIALADLKNNHGVDTIGISFPCYKYEQRGNGKEFAMLGNKLRVFAPLKDDLIKLDLKQWLEKVNTNTGIKINWKLDNFFDINDYIHIKGIKDVPTNNDMEYISVHRYRFKPVEVQAKSLAEKLGIGLDEANEIVANRKPELKLPFIQMHSQTNKSNYPLQILQQPSDNEVTGSFNVYGMNGMATYVTVPQWR